jgi:lactoylglutathione lyase
LQAAGSSDAAYVPNRPAADPVAAQVAFVSDDIAADWHRALAAGANVAKAPEAKPWGQTAGYLRDCNGVLVELSTRSPRDAA